MGKVTMKALDTMHISNVQADNLLAGDKFDISEAEAKMLEDRGLAKRVGVAKDKPENKMMKEAPEIKPISQQPLVGLGNKPLSISTAPKSEAK